MQKTRFHGLDVLRGVAVVLMIIFHTGFDVNFHGLISFDILHHPFWFALPRVIVFLFFFCAGFALQLSHSPSIQRKSLLKRQLKLALASVLISIITYVAFPQNWIYFGTLHCLFTMTFILLLFRRYTALGLGIALALFIPSILWDKNLPFIDLPIASFDYISLFPWIGAGFMGQFMAEHFPAFIHYLPKSRSLQFLGRHSFVLYLTHQAVLFPFVFLLKML